MKIKSIFPIMLVILLGASILPLSAATTVDDFNRASLGTNWSADPSYAIVSNALSNTSTVATWEDLAIYKLKTSPTEVSMKFAANGTVSGVNAAGICIYLTNYDPSAAEGYMVMRRNSELFLLAVMNGEVIREPYLYKVNATLAAPQPGDKVGVKVTNDATGYHFDFYINDTFDARISDPGKLYGNSYYYYSGVSLYGSVSNDVDDFTVKSVQIPITAPVGGETWVVGETKNITWSMAEYADNVDIDYSVDGGSTWVNIADNIANTGTYAWLIPNNASSNCLVRVSGATDGTPFGISAATFEIVAEVQSITVTSPNGGETWSNGSSQNITWTSQGTIANVKIDYSTDNGTTWTAISASTTNDGSYTWTVPTVTTSQALIRVQDLDGNPTDQSNAAFTISTTQVVLSVQSASGEQGETVNVNVSLNNQIPIRGVQFRLTDTADYLEAVDVTGVNRASTFNVTWEESGTYVQVLIVNTTTFTSIPAGSGPIAQISFDVDPGVTYGETSSLTFSKVLISNESGASVVPTLVSGLFHYVLTGDIVPTGVVDDDDIDRIVEIILGLGDAATDIEKLAGDIDLDGDIDMFDALQVFDIAHP